MQQIALRNPASLSTAFRIYLPKFRMVVQEEIRGYCRRRIAIQGVGPVRPEQDLPYRDVQESLLLTLRARNLHITAGI